MRGNPKQRFHVLKSAALPAPVPGVPQLFCDGGMIFDNPSPHGGTWAWCEAEGGKRIRRDSGLLLCEDADGLLITNNATETLAILNALQHYVDEIATSEIFDLGARRQVRLHTDSSCAAGWTLGNGPSDATPHYLMDRVLALREVLATGRLIVEVFLLGGHPNPADIKRGWRVQNGKSELPVSKFNLWCDEECSRRANEYAGRTARKPNPDGGVVTKNGLPRLPLANVPPARIFAVPALASASTPARQMHLFEADGGALA